MNKTAFARILRKPDLFPSRHWLPTLIFTLAFGLMASSILQKSATVDEQSHLFRGAAYLEEGATHFLLGHPLLGSIIAALPLLTEPDLQLPVTDPAWEAGNWSLAGDAFLWRINDNPQRLIFLGRLPIIWLTLLLGALLFRWGRELAGYWPAFLVLFLWLLDPNVLAHGRLITTDLSVTSFMTLAVYGYWRWATKRGQPTASIVLTGLGFGLAGATKFNAALLLPMLGGLGLVLAVKRRDWRPLTALVFAGIIGWAVIWAVYGFAIRPLPGGAFWDDLFWVARYFAKPHSAYLAGRISTDGWWYYFPVAFLLKTPLPTLALLVWAAVRTAWGRRFDAAWFLLLPALIYFLFSLTSSLDIGYRHLLPMLPFLFLFAAVTLGPNLVAANWRTGILTVLAGWLLLTSLFVWPDYIPYFNSLAGGRGWRILSDSNVDWGQDLPALADWRQAQDRPLKLSYFGMAHPSAYGLDFDPLPTWLPGPEQGNPALQTYNPADPAPGLYAISVTNLHGVVLDDDRDAYAWFREREPLARIGGSIFIYDVAARGAAANLALSGLRPAQLAADLQAQLGTNDVHVRWFDAASSFIWPAQGGWLAVPADVIPAPALSAFWPPDMIAAAETDTGSQSLYRLPPPPPLAWPGMKEIAEAPTTFLGYQQLETAPGEVALLTAWRVNQTEERPLKIFIHALDEDGRIIGQWDGLSVAPSGWQPGDLFVHLHRFPVSDTPFSLAAGLYDGETLTRIIDPIRLEALKP